MFRFPRRAARVVRKRPRLTLLLTLLLVAGATIGVWRYSVHLWREAQVALKEDRPQEARARLEFCLRVWPRSPEVHLAIARAARLMGDFPAAEAYLNRCIELQGGASEAVQLEFLLMRVQAGEVDDRGPVSVLFHAVENGHPEASIILETIAKAYLVRLRYRPAYDCLNLWIEIEPQNPKPYYWRGWTLERINNPKAAKADYDRALELDPDMLLARLRVAEMHLHDKQAPEAYPHLERLYKQAPNDPRVQARMGMCLFLMGRPEARQLMESAVIELPNDASLLIALATLDIQQGRGADAEHRLRIVLADDPADTEALFVLASALQLQDRTAEASVVLADYEKKRKLVDRINALLKDVADSPTAGADDYAELGQFFSRSAGTNLQSTGWTGRWKKTERTRLPTPRWPRTTSAKGTRPRRKFTADRFARPLLRARSRD
ncbi:MAG: tetratricopeptide repeat protein [Planctomycetia bacterium]|nr:tetratricopeptide repeat protein [Planctomycetia bacterium]